MRAIPLMRGLTLQCEFHVLIMRAETEPSPGGIDTAQTCGQSSTVLSASRKWAGSSVAQRGGPLKIHHPRSVSTHPCRQANQCCLSKSMWWGALWGAQAVAVSVYLAGSRRLKQMKMPPLYIHISNTGFHMTKLTVFAAYSPDGSPAEWDSSVHFANEVRHLASWARKMLALRCSKQMSSAVEMEMLPIAPWVPCPGIHTLHVLLPTYSQSKLAHTQRKTNVL